MTPQRGSDPSTSSGRMLWVGLIVAVLVPRLLSIALSGDRKPEMFEPEILAHNLLAGKGYTDPHHGNDYVSSHSGFPYVALTAVVYTFSEGSHTAMLVAQSLITVVLVLVTNALGRRLGGFSVGWLAGFLVAFHPGLFYYDTRNLHPLGFDAMLLTATTLMLIRMMSCPSLGRCAVAGAVGGLTLLQRGTIIPVLAASIVGLWWIGKNKEIAARGSMALLLSVGLVVGPWLVRNFMHHGTLILMTSAAEHLWRGNNPHATGTSLTRDGLPMIETADPQFLTTLHHLDELGQMRLFRETAIRYIVERPGTFVRNVAARCGYFIWFAPTSGMLYPRLYLWMYQVYYALMLLMAGIGLVTLRRRLQAEDHDAKLTLLFLVGVWTTVGLMQSLFYVEIRHRWGVEALMLVLSAVGLARTGSCVLSSLPRRPACAGRGVV